MPQTVRQDNIAPAGDDRSLEALHAEVWADRCTIARLLTNVAMFMLVWVVVAMAAFALMSR